MNRIYNFLRKEMDVEVLTGAHVLSLIIIYGIQKLFIKEYTIEFLYIVEMFTMTYVVTWAQRFLFIKKSYTKLSNMIHTILWFAIPILIESLCIYLFDWYHNFPSYSPILMILFIMFYYVVMWITLHKLYNSETIELNGMLHHYQESQRLWHQEVDHGKGEK